MGKLRDAYVHSVEYSSCDESLFHERMGAWKIFLPATPTMAILAIGVSKYVLVSLARSWNVVHALNVERRDFYWSLQQLQKVGFRGRLSEIESRDLLPCSYGSIAIDVDSGRNLNLQSMLELLAPGGAIAWFGGHANLLSAHDLSEAGYVDSRRYALLPPDGLRIILPLNDSRLTKAGLRLFVPAKAINRLAVNVARFLSLAGYQRFLGIRQVVVARKKGNLPGASYILDWMSQQLNRPVTDATVHPGTNDADGVRKPTLQLLDNHGQVIGIAKLADMDGARKAIDRETFTLKRLNTFSDIRAAIPTIITNGEWNGHAVQVQSAVGPGKKRFCPNIQNEHLQFLICLSKVDRTYGVLEKWRHWPTIWHWAQNTNPTPPNHINSLSTLLTTSADKLKGLILPFHRIHGDFAPWNVLIGKNTISVVDWEQSDADGLPLYDLVYFLTRRIANDNMMAHNAAWFFHTSQSIIKDHYSIITKYIQNNASLKLDGLTHDSLEACLSLCTCIIYREIQTKLPLVCNKY